MNYVGTVLCNRDCVCMCIVFLELVALKSCASGLRPVSLAEEPYSSGFSLIHSTLRVDVSKFPVVHKSSFFISIPRLSSQYQDTNALLGFIVVIPLKISLNSQFMRPLVILR